MASIITGEASGCSVQAKEDLAWVIVHRDDAGIEGGWAAIAEPTSEDMLIAIAVYARKLGDESSKALDRYPETLFAVSQDDLNSGKLYWLVGRDPYVYHKCNGHEVILF